MSTGDYQEQQYQLPLCRRHAHCATLRYILQIDAVLLMLTRMLMAPRRSKMNMACAHTSRETLPTLCAMPAARRQSQRSIVLRQCPNMNFSELGFCLYEDTRP